MHRLIYLLLLLAPSAAFADDTTIVRGFLHEGVEQIHSERYELALEACRLGLKNLGNAYSSPEILDDTDLKLMAAEILEKEGKLGNAAIVTCRMLRSRYELWEMKGRSGAKKPNHSFNTDALTRAG